MSQQKIELSNTPQNLGSNAAYISSHGGNFRFAFGGTPDLNIINGHTDSKLYYDGSLGELWVWKSVGNQVVLEVSIAE